VLEESLMTLFFFLFSFSLRDFFCRKKRKKTSFFLEKEKKKEPRNLRIFATKKDMRVLYRQGLFCCLESKFAQITGI
jgi:hypothetical protein